MDDKSSILLLFLSREQQIVKPQKIIPMTLNHPSPVPLLVPLPAPLPKTVNLPQPPKAPANQSLPWRPKMPPLIRLPQKAQPLPEAPHSRYFMEDVCMYMNACVCVCGAEDHYARLPEVFRTYTFTPSTANVHMVSWSVW